MKHTNERGALPMLVAILVVLVIALIGVAIYNASRSQKSGQTANVSPSPSPAATPTPHPATCSVEASDGWKTATSGMAKFNIKYPGDWSCKPGTNNGGAETIYLTSPNKFEIQLVSFTQASRYGREAGNSCGGCIKTDSSETINILGYGTALLDAVTAGAGGGTSNQLILRTSSQSIQIASPKVPDVRTTVWSVFQGKSEDEQTRMTPAEFAASSDVQAAKQILRSLSYQ